MRYFLILCGILSFHIASAQKNLASGKIETNEGQIIEGEIVFKDKSITPQEIEFFDQTGRRQKYNPTELKSFEIEGIKFVSRIVSIDVTPQRLHKQDYLNRKRQISDTIFLSLQIKSAISLLYYKDVDYREHFFIQIEEGELIELIKHEYFDKVRNPNSKSNEEKLITNYKYKNQLGYAFKTCPSVVEKLNNVAFKLNEIQKLIVEYNECSGSSIEDAMKNQKIDVEFGLTAGIAFQDLILESDERIFVGLDLIDFKPSTNPILGIYLDLVFPMNYRKWSMNNMLLFTPFVYQVTDTIHTAYTKSYDKVYFDLSGSYLKLLSKLRYTFTNNKIRPFVNAGFSIGYLTSFKNVSNSEFVSYSVVVQTESQAIEKYKNFEIGLQAGVGLKIGDKISVEYIFEGSDGMSKYTRLKTSFKRSYIVGSYMF